MSTFHVRFSLMGAIALAALFCVWATGWAERIVAADTTYIIGLQTLMLLIAMYYVWQRRWSRVFEFRGILVELGLVGTVIGMILSMRDIDPSQVGNAAAAGKIAAGFIAGLGIALYTTLVGAIYAAWLWLLRQVLDVDVESARS